MNLRIKVKQIKILGLDQVSFVVLRPFLTCHFCYLCQIKRFERRTGSKTVTHQFVQTSTAVLLCLANLSLRFISTCRAAGAKPNTEGSPSRPHTGSVSRYKKKKGKKSPRLKRGAFGGYKPASDGKARPTRRSGLNEDRAESAMAFTQACTCKMYGFALFPPSSQSQCLSAS